MARKKDSKQPTDPERQRPNKWRQPLSAAGSDGASLSNTAPAKYINPNLQTQILRSGVDSLYLSYPGDLPKMTEEELESRKAFAQSQDAEIAAEASHSTVDQPFVVLPKGRGRFAYVMVNNWYQIALSASEATSMPLAHVQISSELLTRSGAQAPVRALTNIISVLAQQVIHPKISRVDLCVDFVPGVDLKAFADEEWITRARILNRHSDGGKFTGYTFGNREVMCCRLYNKSIEIRKSGKLYMEDIWKECGWDGECDVWRLEFEFRRPVLKELSIHKMAELIGNLNSLWHYATHSCLQLKIMEWDSNPSRWDIHPFWQLLQTATFNDLGGQELTRTRKDRAPDDKYLFQNGIAGITSFMAREGITDFMEALALFGSKAQEFYINEFRYNGGQTLQNYAQKKATEKRTRYNLHKPREKTRKDTYQRSKGKDDEK